MNNNNSTSEPNNDNGGFDANGFTYGMVFAIGLVFLLISVATACFRLRRTRSSNFLNNFAGIPPQPHEGEFQDSAEQGLSGSHQINTSFESYPKMLYSQVHNKSGSSSSCSICLGDYKETDMLRLLPDCGHLYHLDCVDPWLRLHSTCPICRKSSLQAPHPMSN